MVFMGRISPSPLRAGHQWAKNKKPPWCGTRRAKVGWTFQNPRGAPVTADTITDERLEEPIRRAEALCPRRFMT